LNLFQHSTRPTSAFLPDDRQRRWSVEMLGNMGWWIFDAETRTLINRKSDQRVRFEGAVDGAGGSPAPGSGPVRWRFSYQDAEVRYPVLVTARHETYGGPGFDRRREPTLGWSIDHAGSAAEWRRTGGAREDVPPYGLWRRVDEALFDALACWPATEATGPISYRVDSWGGWLNGAWCPRLRRVARGRAEEAREVEDGVRPYLEPLTSAPLAWQFVDAGKAEGGASVAGIRALADGRRFLPGEAPLTGFEAAIPHLRRSDGKAVMFPCGVRGARDRDGYYYARAFFFYADEDVFFRLEGSSQPTFQKGVPRHWRFDLDDLLDLGVRRDPDAAALPAGLVCRRVVYDWREAYLQPLPRLAQRLTTALIDGCLAWSGSRLRLREDPARLKELAADGSPQPTPPLANSGIDLEAKALVEVNHRYQGGRFFGGSFTGYVQQDGWTEPGFPLP
jgi:hypothetical protein